MRDSVWNRIFAVLETLCGLFHFWTDVEQYFEEACLALENEAGLSAPVMVEEPESTHDMDYRTHFERRMRKNGHDVFRAHFIRL